MTPFANHPHYRSIPMIADATVQVTYIVVDADAVKAIAEEVGARLAPTWDLPSLHEHHYEADGEPERWILAVCWEHDSVSYSAQSAATSAPSLVSA